MIDNFSLALTHGLMILAAWYLLKRDDFDREPSPRDVEQAKQTKPAKQATQAKPKKGRWRA